MIMQAGLLAIVMLGASAAASRAAIIAIEMGGWCIERCDLVGLSPRDRYSGTVVLDDSYFSPGAFARDEAIVDWSVTMGNLSLSMAETSRTTRILKWLPEYHPNDPLGSVDFLGVWGWTSDASGPGPAVHVGAARSWHYQTHSQAFPRWTGVLGGDHALFRAQTLPAVPLPAAGWLSLAGIGALAAFLRRRTRQG